LTGAVVSVCLHFFVSLPRTDCVAVSRKELAWAGILKPLAYALPLLLVTQVLTRWIAAPVSQLVLFAASELVLLLLFWKFSFDAGDREQLKGLLCHVVSTSGKLLPVLRPE
jgi:hypothetical protein